MSPFSMNFDLSQLNETLKHARNVAELETAHKTYKNFSENACDLIARNLNLDAV